MDTLLASQPGATSIVSAPPILLNPSSASLPAKGPAPSSYRSSRKASRGVASLLTGARIGFYGPSATRTSGRQKS